MYRTTESYTIVFRVRGAMVSSITIRARNSSLLLVATFVSYATRSDCVRVNRGMVGKFVHNTDAPILLMTKIMMIDVARVARIV